MAQALKGRGFRFHTAGIGAGHLPQPAALDGVSIILLCGVAGALDPALTIGDVILDDPGHRISDSSLYRRGRIHTAGEIISTPAKKATLYADTGTLAVDMEQSIVRDFAAQRHIPVIGLRAISDTADQILDSAVLNLVDDLGRPRATRIASALIRRPSLARHLNRLNSNTKIALKNLSAALIFAADHLNQTG